MMKKREFMEGVQKHSDMIDNNFKFIYYIKEMMHDNVDEIEGFEVQDLVHLDMNGPDLLHFAAFIGHSKMVYKLLELGVSIDTIP